MPTAPPTQNLSPALSPAYLKYTFNIEADEVELTEVLRQQKGNDIVHSAQKLRQLCNNPHPAKWAKFPLRGYNNIHLVNTSIDLIDLYLKRVKEVGYNNATFIAGTNAQCNKLAQILRPSFGITSSNLAVGDLLLVTQNNYITSMMNGDLVIITDIGTIERRAGLTFQHVSYEEIITKKTYSQWLISDILNSNTTNLTPQQHKELLIDYTERMKRIGIKQKDTLYNEKMMKDPYLNALRAVYGYALTTHKAQGGEWDYVYLDIPKSMSARDFAYQWVYTAMTRARKELFIVDDWWII